MVSKKKFSRTDILREVDTMREEVSFILKLETVKKSSVAEHKLLTLRVRLDQLWRSI